MIEWYGMGTKKLYMGLLWADIADLKSTAAFLVRCYITKNMLGLSNEILFILLAKSIST